MHFLCVCRSTSSDLYLSSTGYYIATPQAELKKQAEAMFAAQSRTQPMAKSANARREAEARAGRERARLAKLQEEEEERQQAKAERREAAQKALDRARRNKAAKATNKVNAANDDGRTRFASAPRRQRRSRVGVKAAIPRDYYADLGVSSDASDEEIRSAYRSLALKHHPDKVASNEVEQATAKFATINMAWDVLGCSDRRRVYDLQRKVAGGDAQV